jgi:nucleotide-binding universal stress UspA family protein
MSGVTGPSIVVGISGSAGSAKTLRWAADEARLRHGHLRVVLAWEPAFLASYSPVSAHADHDQQERTAHQALAWALQAAFGSDPPPGLVTKVVEGVAERVLVAESDAADLLVLGATPAPGRPGPAAGGTAVGRVVRGCLRQAHCPVMVIGLCDKPAPSGDGPALPASRQDSQATPAEYARA